MIVAEDKKIKKCPVSLQPDIENLLQDLSPDDFTSASRQEKDDFIHATARAFPIGRMPGED